MRDWTENQIKVVLIRHGMTGANREHRYLGWTDESLSEEGRSTLFRMREAGIYPETDFLFSSPMKRCLETAGILYPDRTPVVIPEWKEIDFGAFEGKNYMELQKDARYQEWIDSNGTLPFPGGESREQFTERCVLGFERMLEKLCELCGEAEFVVLAKQKQLKNSIGLIVHGGTIMALLSRYCGGEYFEYQVPNGGGYICTLSPDGGKPVLKACASIITHTE